MVRKSNIINPVTPEEIAVYDECVKILKGTSLRLTDRILVDSRTEDEDYRIIPEPGTKPGKRPKC